MYFPKSLCFTGANTVYTPKKFLVKMFKDDFQHIEIFFLSSVVT